jgi:hypothetical protein
MSEKIANALSEHCEWRTFQGSEFWAVYGQTAPYRLSSGPNRSGGRWVINELPTNRKQSFERFGVSHRRKALF